MARHPKPHTAVTGDLICKVCGSAFRPEANSTRRRYRHFCGTACIQTHKVKLANMHSSKLEATFGDCLRVAGIMPVEQYPLGPYVFDFALPQAQLLVEVDGERYHAAAKPQARDDRKDALARQAGWRVVRVPQWIVQHHPGEGVRAVLDALLDHTSGADHDTS